MSKYKVTPTDGRCDAPYYIIDVDGSLNTEKQKEAAVAQARSRSGLFRFILRWKFFAEKIRR